MKISGILCLCLGVWASSTVAHPIPDIPVFSSFDQDTLTIEVVIDPGSFTDDPEWEPYMHNSELGFMNEAELEELKDKGQELINRTVVFQFSPEAKVKPVFDFDFTGLDKSELERKADPVMLIGPTTLEIPAGATGYQLVADESGELSVIFRNELKGKEVGRYMVLFLGESSFELDISER